MAGQCPNGTERKPGSPPGFVVRVSDVFERVGRRGGAFVGSGSSIVTLGLTDSFCNGSPESEFVPARYPGDWFAAAANDVITSRWNELCRCKRQSPPPPFVGGQCPVIYNVFATATYQFRRAPFEVRTTTAAGQVRGPFREVAETLPGVTGSEPSVGERRYLFSPTNQNLFQISSDEVKPGSYSIRWQITRADNQPDNCGNQPVPGGDLPNPPTPYVVSPVYYPPESEKPCPPCNCPGTTNFPTLEGIVPREAIDDFKKFLELVKKFPRLQLPRPPWFPKPLADYFNAANLLTWLRFVEPEDMKDCCPEILARLAVIEERGNRTGEELSIIKAFVERLFIDSGNDRRDILAFLRPISSQVFRIDSIVKQLPDWNTAVQVGLNNIFNRQAAYQGETNRNFLATGAAIGAFATASALAAAAAAKTLAAIVAQNVSTLAQLAALRAYLELLRQSLFLRLSAIEQGLKSDIRALAEFVRAEVRSLAVSIDQARRDIADSLQIVQARFNQTNNFLQSVGNSILNRVDNRANRLESLLASLLNNLNIFAQNLGIKLDEISRILSIVEGKIGGILPAIASLRERMDNRFDGLIECLEIPGNGANTVSILATGNSGSVALPARCVAVRFRAVGTVPNDKSKKQEGRGQADVIQGGWCWLSSGGFLARRMPLDSRNKVFAVKEFAIGRDQSFNIVWTGANLIDYEVSAIIAPQTNKPPYGERPCQT